MPVEDIPYSGRVPMNTNTYNGTHNNHHHQQPPQTGGPKENERCSCCPYGYHIDRDFVPFTKKMLSREANVDRLRELRSKLRSQRKSMDKLLGVPKLPSQPSTWEFTTLSRASVDVWRSEVKRERVNSLSGGDEIYPAEDSVYINQLPRRVLAEPHSQPEEDAHGLKVCLQAAVQEFEDALNRTRPLNSRTLTYDVPDSQKFHTFPRLKPSKEISLDGDVLIMREMRESRASIRNLTNNNKMEGSLLSDYVPPSVLRQQNVFKKKHDSAENMNMNGEHETLANKFSTSNQHESMELAANRIRDLEDQVKMIPELQVKVTLLTEEKRQVMKLLENEKMKRAKVEEVYQSLKDSQTPQIGDVNQNVLVEPVVESKPLTRDAGVGKSVLTRDVGSSPVSPTLRSVAVGENVSWDRLQSMMSRSDTSSPTGSGMGSLRRRIRSFEIGVQVTELDLGIKSVEPLLQIVEKVDCGTQAMEEVVPVIPAKVIKTKTVGVQQKPRTIDVGVLSKPKSRDATVGTVAPDKPRTKQVGVTADLLLDPPPVEKSDVSLETVAPAQDPPKSLPIISNTSISVNTDLSFSPDEEAAFGSPVGKSEEWRSLSDIPTSPKLNPSSSFTVLTEGRSRICNLPTIGDSSETNLPLAVPSSPTDQKPPSRIPRLTTPSTSPNTSPKSVVKSPEFEQVQSSRSGGTYKSPLSPTKSQILRPPPLKRQDTYTKESHGERREEDEDSDEVQRKSASESSEEEDQFVHHPSITTVHECSPIEETKEREKVAPSKEMLGALKVLNDALLRGRTTQQVTAAISIILHEWFGIAGTKSADPADVEDYLDSFENFSPQLLRYIVNMPDGNGNTAMHYAVSHGNFDVVSILLDSKVCDPNKANKAGYTSVMLVSLAKVLSDTHRQVVRRLFSLGDVNIKAAQHGQTALMLAASHGRLDTVRLLLEAGADINIQDEDGSTALMCASEHGHGEIVKYFLTQSDCDPHITDNDGSTALSVSMEAGHKDIGVMLYAHMHFVARSPSSPGSMRAKKSRSETPRSSPHNQSSPSFSSQTSPVIAKKQYSTHT